MKIAILIGILSSIVTGVITFSLVRKINPVDVNISIASRKPPAVVNLKPEALSEAIPTAVVQSCIVLGTAPDESMMNADINAVITLRDKGISKEDALELVRETCVRVFHASAKLDPELQSKALDRIGVSFCDVCESAIVDYVYDQ